MKPKDVAVTLDQIPGGHYTCQDNGDGTWNILDVPIMGEMFEGEKGVPFDLGREWHLAALAKAEQRESEGHLGSNHVYHHEKGVSTKRAGYLRLRRVGSCWHDVREQSCLYADLIRVPDNIFQLIDKAELPYRSVEVASWEEPEIASLALMPDETPFFRLPMLTTGAKVKCKMPVHCSIKESPALAYAEASTGGGGYILFNLGGPMAKKPAAKPAKTAAKPEEAEEKKPSLKEQLAALLKDPNTKDEDIQKLMKGETEGNPGEEDDLRTGRFAEKPEEQTDPADDVVEEAEEEPADAKGIAKNAKLQARIDLLERKDAKRERTDKVASLVNGANAKLKGRYLSAETKTNLRELAESDLTGKSLNIFVKSYLQNVPPDETGDEDEAKGERFGTSDVVAPEEPEVIAKLAAKSPEAHARGRRLMAEYEAGLRSGHIHGKMTLERYIDINTALPPLKAKASN